MTAEVRDEIRALERTEALQWEDLREEEIKFEEFKFSLDQMRQYRIDHGIRPAVPEVWRKKDRAARKRVGRFRYQHQETLRKIKFENIKLLDIAVGGSIIGSVEEVFSMAKIEFGVA